MEQEIKHWKELGIAYADFNFSCGGDSMNDTELSFYDNKGNQIDVSNTNLDSYFDNEVYNAVSFYEASDGHYQGESGYVRINLEDDEESFAYTKVAQSEWSETYSETIIVELTEAEKKFIEENISNMNYGDNWSSEFNVNYKKDLILTDEMESMLTDLHDKFLNEAESWTPKTENGEVEDDTLTYSTDIGGEDIIQFVDNGIKLEVSCRVIEYTDSDE